MNCTICNSERKCNFFEPYQICGCRAIHSLCWVEKMKDKDICPVCKEGITIMDVLEVYGDDLDYTYVYSYYDEVLYLKSTLYPDGDLYIDEFFEKNGKLENCIYYYKGTQIPEREYFMNDKKHTDKYYYPNGTIKEIVEFDTEKKTNKVNLFDIKGNILSEEIYNKDYYSKKNYNENGILMSEDIYDYVNNKKKQIFYNLSYLAKGATYTIERNL